jgi:hypothetical protein
MNWLEVLQIAGVTIAFLVAAGAGIGGFWYAFNSKERKLLKEQVAENKAAVDACEAKHGESEKAIANLQGQIDFLKTVPLAEIAISMEALAKSNTEILTTLRRSAVIAATDRDILTGSTIKEQHVDNQIVGKAIVNKGE